VATVVVVLVGLPRWRRLGHGRSLVLGCGVIAFAAWLVLFVTTQAFAPRLAYLAFPAWIALIALTLDGIPRRIYVAGIVAGLVALNVWTLTEIADVKTADASQVIAAGSLWR
jgi:hypothetical protein